VRENAIAIILNGLAPTQDKVSLFTFPAMEVGSASNDTNCSGNQATGEPYTFPSTKRNFAADDAHYDRKWAQQQYSPDNLPITGTSPTTELRCGQVPQ